MRTGDRLGENKINDAIEDIKSSVKDEPDLANAHYYLGLAYQASGNLRTAKSELSEAIKLNPNLDGARLALSTIYVGFRDYELAQTEIQKGA